jgi:hypothetical protein
LKTPFTKKGLVEWCKSAVQAKIPEKKNKNKKTLHLFKERKVTGEER